MSMWTRLMIVWVCWGKKLKYVTSMSSMTGWRINNTFKFSIEVLNWIDDSIKCEQKLLINRKSWAQKAQKLLKISCLRKKSLKSSWPWTEKSFKLLFYRSFFIDAMSLLIIVLPLQSFIFEWMTKSSIKRLLTSSVVNGKSLWVLWDVSRLICHFKS